jgi:hypothetical protein
MAPDMRLFVSLHVNVDKTAAHSYMVQIPLGHAPTYTGLGAASLIPTYSGNETRAYGAVSLPWLTRLGDSGILPSAEVAR